jgi:hypothetical protein
MSPRWCRQKWRKIDLTKRAQDWKSIAAEVTGEVDTGWLMIDATYSKVHVDGCGLIGEGINMTQSCIRSDLASRTYFDGSNSGAVSPLGMLNASIPFSPLSLSSVSSSLLDNTP